MGKCRRCRWRIRSHSGSSERSPDLNARQQPGRLSCHPFQHVPKAQRAVAIAAQFSVAPEVLPAKDRWRHLTADISEWRYPSLEGSFNTTTAYFTLNGGGLKERQHWRRFPRAENAKHYIFPRFRHRLARKLKGRGELSAVIDHLLSGPLDVCLTESGATTLGVRRFG